MNIREALANMSRGAGPALVGGFLVEFDNNGRFNISSGDGAIGFFESTSLKDSVSFIEDHDPLTGQRPETSDPSYDAPMKGEVEFLPPKALHVDYNEEKKAAYQLYGGSAPMPYGYINTEGFDNMCQMIFMYNKDAGWWTDLNTGEPLKRNVGEMLMLVVSEISEAMEGHRKDLMDDKLPHRKMIEVELADAVIRICDIAGGLGLDVAGAIQEKVIFNMNRPDHKTENRLAGNGKKY